MQSFLYLSTVIKCFPLDDLASFLKKTNSFGKPWTEQKFYETNRMMKFSAWHNFYGHNKTAEQQWRKELAEDAIFLQIDRTEKVPPIYLEYATNNLLETKRHYFADLVWAKTLSKNVLWFSNIFISKADVWPYENKPCAFRLIFGPRCLRNGVLTKQ